MSLGTCTHVLGPSIWEVLADGIRDLSRQGGTLAVAATKLMKSEPFRNCSLIYVMGLILRDIYK